MACPHILHYDATDCDINSNWSRNGINYGRQKFYRAASVCGSPMKSMTSQRNFA